jgi:hypothetical protein
MALVEGHLHSPAILFPGAGSHFQLDMASSLDAMVDRKKSLPWQQPNPSHSPHGLVTILTFLSSLVFNFCYWLFNHTASTENILMNVEQLVEWKSEAETEAFENSCPSTTLSTQPDLG